VLETPHEKKRRKTKVVKPKQAARSASAAPTTPEGQAIIEPEGPHAQGTTPRVDHRGCVGHQSDAPIGRTHYRNDPVKHDLGGWVGGDGVGAGK